MIPPPLAVFEEDVREDDFNTGEEQVLDEVDSTLTGFLLYGISQCIKDLAMLNYFFLYMSGIFLAIKYVLRLQIDFEHLFIAQNMFVKECQLT